MNGKVPAGALAAALALVLVAAACGGDDDDSGGGRGDGGGQETQDTLGEGEGAVSILAWPGYAEDGSTDPAYDWVTPFEEETGCDTSVKVFNTSDEAVQLMKTGEYDVVSASGDATLRLIAAGDVAPVNTDLVPNYADVADFLKDREWNSSDGEMYGIPHGWGANLLMFNTEEVDPAPTSWGAVFDSESPYAGKVTAYDSPIYIADAALYLMKTQPDLGIENPYALDADQFEAAVDLLKTQKSIIGEYWSDYLKQEEAFQKGSLVMGTSWQIIVNTLQVTDPPTPVDAILPEEGSTAWSDTWMLATDAQHPNCAYLWMDWIVSPEINIQVAEYFGEAPANLKACDEASDPAFCDTYHANDKAYYDQLWYWTTPSTECIDGRDVECTDYQEWTRAWDEIKG